MKKYSSNTSLRRIAPLLSLFILVGVLLGFKQLNPIENLILNFKDYNLNYPEEVVWMHLNKPSFAVGEEIWFSAYVAEKDTRSPSGYSNVFYVNLVDEEGKVLEHKNYPIHYGVAKGSIPIPALDRDSQVSLIGFTSLYKKDNRQHYFAKELQIKTQNKDEIYLNLSFSDSIYTKGTSGTATINALGQDGFELEKAKIDWELSDGIQSGTIETNEEGTATIDFVVANTLKDGEPLILNLKGKKSNIDYRWMVPLEDQMLKLDLFPEGGQLVAGHLSKVAFKATDLIGEPTNITGHLLTNTGDTTVSIKSFHEGMGQFRFQPKAGVSYSAVVEDEKGYRSTVKLPKVQSDGMTLNLTPQERSILVSIQAGNQPSLKAATLAITLGKELIWLNRIELNNSFIRFPFDTSELPAGMIRFTLFNDDAEPLAERMAFVNIDKQLTIGVNTFNAIPTPGDSLDLEIEALNPDGQPSRNASISLRVYDSAQAKDETEISIKSGLLLNPELKGRVPTPNFYFQDKSDSAKKALDLVALTHGWRTFDWEWMKDSTYLDYQIRNPKDIITGVLTDAEGRAISGKKVDAVDEFALFGNFETRTDENGFFAIPLEIPTDSTIFKFNLDGSKEFNLEFIPFFEYEVPDWEPSLADFQTYSIGQKVKIENLPLYTDFESIQVLEEIVITADRPSTKIEKWKENKTKNAFATRTVDREEIVKAAGGSGAGQNIQDIINQFAPAFNGQYRGITSLNSESSITYVLNGRRVFDIQELDWIRPNMIETINIYKGGTGGLYAFEGAGGTVEIFTTDFSNSDDIRASLERSLIRTAIYDTPRAYYEPLITEFQQAGVKDLRPSIYWNPQLKLDEFGRAFVSFRLSQAETNFVINAEGFSDYGMGSVETSVSTLK